MMVAYNFKDRFAWLVEDGIKRQTVRAMRKRETVKGDTLQLYVGQRTKHCRLMRVAECARIDEVTIAEGSVKIGKEWLSYKMLREFAWRDGFRMVDEFLEFFERGEAWSGRVFYWSVDTTDSVVYGVLDMTVHLRFDLLGNEIEKDSFTDKMLRAGVTLWWASGKQRVIGIKPWNFDVWAREMYIVPEWIMTGKPAEWAKF